MLGVIDKTYFALPCQSRTSVPPFVRWLLAERAHGDQRPWLQTALLGSLIRNGLYMVDTDLRLLHMTPRPCYGHERPRISYLDSSTYLGIHFFFYVSVFFSLLPLGASAMEACKVYNCACLLLL